MGLSNLICSRLELQPTVEFYDEPTQWLSESGIQDLLGVLLERAKKYRKVILLADHRGLSFGQFSGTIMVTKDRGGSRLHV